MFSSSAAASVVFLSLPLQEERMLEEELVLTLTNLASILFSGKPSLHLLGLKT